MTEKPRSEKKGGGAAVLAVGLGLLVALFTAYVASVGPAAWLLHRGWIGETGFTIAYAPLLWIAENSELASDWYLRYTWWWKWGIS